MQVQEYLCIKVNLRGEILIQLYQRAKKNFLDTPQDKVQASAAAALAANNREDCIVLSMLHIVRYWVCITWGETLSQAFYQ